MIIKKIAIENYRGVATREEVPLGSFCSIVGKNDSGKSIILNAIASFLNTKDFPIVDADFFDPDKPISMELTLTAHNLIELLESRMKSKIKKADGLEDFLKDIIFENEIVFKKTFIEPGKTASTETLQIRDFEKPEYSGLYAKDDDSLNAIIDAHAISIPTKGKGRNSKIEKIKHIKEFLQAQKAKISIQWISDEYKISTLLPAVELFYSDYGLKADTTFKTSSVTEILDYFKRETSNADKKLALVEREIQTEMEAEAESIKTYMLEYTPTLEKVQIQPAIVWKDAIKSVEVNLRFSGDDRLIPMSHKGTGYRRLFMVARFRYLAEKANSSNIIYLIEEPETYLHPSAQEDLLNSLRSLSTENQIILATHSPIFAGAMKFDSVVLCKKNKQSNYTHAGKADQTDFINQIIAELGIRPAYNLRDTFEKILFVESKNDWFFYDCICKALFGKSMFQNEKILVLPYGGGDNIESFVNIEHFAQTGRPLFLIVDSDKGHQNEAGQKARVEDFNTKKNAKGIALKKRCIENYYHPRAIERAYELKKNIFDFFDDVADVPSRIKEIADQNQLKGIRGKNNLRIFQEMNKEEWESILEGELISLLKEIIK